MLYRYEVLFTSYQDGVAEGDCHVCDKLSEAKKFIENTYSGLLCATIRVILKYEVGEFGYPARYVKKVWVLRDGKWYATRKIAKYLHLMYL